MSLIAMAVHDTVENKRSELTLKCLISVCRTVAFSKHRMFIIDNNSCEETKQILESFSHIENIKFIHLKENVGTARAINMAWQQRGISEHCIKMDNDVIIHEQGWIEKMEAAIARQPMIGQVGLKRKDCWEHPMNDNPDYRSNLLMLPHEPGEEWIIVEQAKHIIGTCVMHNSKLIDKVGGLWQPTLYGHDDVLMSWRSHLAGFINVFLPQINIDHIDPGGTEYQAWKEREGGKNGKLVSDIVDEYIAGVKSIVYDL